MDNFLRDKKLTEQDVLAQVNGGSREQTPAERVFTSEEISQLVQVSTLPPTNASPIEGATHSSDRCRHQEGEVPPPGLAVQAYPLRLLQ